MRVYEPNSFGLQDVASAFAGDKCEDEKRGGWCQTASLFYMEEMLLGREESFSDRLMLGFKTLAKQMQGDETEEALPTKDLPGDLGLLIRNFIVLFGRDNQRCALTNFLRALAMRYDNLQTTLFHKFVTELVYGKGTGGHDETRRLV